MFLIWFDFDLIFFFFFFFGGGEFLYKMNWVLWGNDIINSLICIFISMFRKMFNENMRNIQIFITFLSLVQFV